MNKTDYFLESSKKCYSLQMYPDAVSRAYYALLHTMVDALDSKKIAADQRHHLIREAFLKNFVKGSDRKRVHDKIKEFQTARENADYKRNLHEQYTEIQLQNYYKEIIIFIQNFAQKI